jgi:hypothetical protein
MRDLGRFATTGFHEREEKLGPTCLSWCARVSWPENGSTRDRTVGGSSPNLHMHQVLKREVENGTT